VPSSSFFNLSRGLIRSPSIFFPLCVSLLFHAGSFPKKYTVFSASLILSTNFLKLSFPSSFFLLWSCSKSIQYHLSRVFGSFFSFVFYYILFENDVWFVLNMDIVIFLCIDLYYYSLQQYSIVHVQYNYISVFYFLFCFSNFHLSFLKPC